LGDERLGRQRRAPSDRAGYPSAQMPCSVSIPTVPMPDRDRPHGSQNARDIRLTVDIHTEQGDITIAGVDDSGELLLARGGLGKS